MLVDVSANVSGLLDAWLRIPYLRGGRSAAGADCWGLVRIVRQAVRGDVLPIYAEVPMDDRAEWTRVQADFAAASFPVVDPMDGAIAFVFDGGLCTHCGIVLTIDGRRCVLDSSSRQGPKFAPKKYFERQYQDVRYYDH